VRGAPADLYAAAFLARCEAMRGRRATIAKAGLRGVIHDVKDPRVQLLVTDDQAHDVLGALLPDARAGMIRIFATAERCTRLVADQLRWRSDRVTAMVSSDLCTVPSLELPGDLRLRPVQRSADDERSGVALTDAVAAAMSASSAIDDPPEVFADYLRSLPPTFRLFAGVDDDGQVRATSGFGVFGRYATVIFVNTDPGWRGRGIGQAMTAQALGAARHAGARYAALDASDAGRSIYLRLGFQKAGMVTRFIA
jgi:ribosomal protein S18 acetylase RimI-like enzyme